AQKEKILLIQPEWDPAVQAECKPQTRAMMEHCMKRGVKFALMAWNPINIQMGEEVARDCEKEYNEKNPDDPKKYGVDWVSWGYKPMNLPVFLAFIKDIYSVIEKDSKGTPIRDVPMMQNVDSLRDVGLVFFVTGSGGVVAYIQFALPEIGFAVSTGCTAVMGPEQYPFLDSGQLVGMLEGMSGAAQYEALINYPEGRGTRGMRSQDFAHLWIIFVTILGNIGYI
ncbi:MAG: hypothetical protein ABH833_03130, partial [Parcubacteria group bacterium]